MSIDAYVLLPLTLDAMRTSMQVGSEDDTGVEFRSSGRSLWGKAVDGGVILSADLAYSTPPEVLAQTLRRDLGEAGADLERVFVFPSVAPVTATSYDAILEELGAGGEWLPLPTETAAIPAGAMGLLGNLPPGLLPPEMGQQMQQMMSDPGAMAQIGKLAESMMSDPSMLQMMQGALGDVASGGDIFSAAQQMASKLGGDLADPDAADQTVEAEFDANGPDFRAAIEQLGGADALKGLAGALPGMGELAAMLTGADSKTTNSRTISGDVDSEDE